MQASVPDPGQVRTIIDQIQSVNVPTEPELIKTLVAPPLITGLDHWSLWVMICLRRHLENQKWVGFIIESRLQGNLSQIGGAGAFGHPEGLPQSGAVPDDEDWSYFFHGCGCCLTNKVSGVEIDVDFTADGRCDAIDPFFYDRYLLSLRQPGFPEKIIRRNEPFESAWHVEIQKLCDAGCLIDKHRITLTPTGLQIFDAIEPLCNEIEKLLEEETPDSLQRAVYGLLALDDFISVEPLSSKLNFSENIIAGLKERVQKAKQDRLTALTGRLERNKDSEISSLVAIGEFGPEWAAKTVEEALFRTPVDGAANTALQIVCAWNKDDLSGLLLRLLQYRYDEIFGFWPRTLGSLIRRGKTNDFLPRGSQIVRASVELLKRSSPASLDGIIRRRLLELAGSVRGANSGEAALLSYVLDKSRGLEHLRTALQSTVPLAYEEATAACVMIGNEYTRNLLLAALESKNLQIQHAAACALQAFPSADTRDNAVRWFKRNDGISDPAGKEIKIGERMLPVYSMDDVSHANMKMFFNSSLERLRKNFGPLI